MGQNARPTRQNRTITVDFCDESTYFQVLSDGKAFVEFILAFLLSIGFQLHHKASCRGGCLTRHSHYARVRLSGLTIWRIQCTTCQAVFTVLPHFVLRYRKMRPEMARDALLATHGGLSLEWCAVICHISPMTLYRVVYPLAADKYSGAGLHSLRVVNQPVMSTPIGVRGPDPAAFGCLWAHLPRSVFRSSFSPAAYTARGHGGTRNNST